MAKKIPVIEESPLIQSAKAPENQSGADHVPPPITGKDVMANYPNIIRILRKRHLAVLARNDPEIAALLRAKVKTPTAEAPKIET